MKSSAIVAFFSAAALAAFGALGCTTNSYCFAGCGENPTSSGGAMIDGGGGSGLLFHSTGGGGTSGDSGFGATAGTCGMAEICNNIDDNCNGQVDEGIDFTDPLQCGTCANDCRSILENVIQSSVTCDPPPMDEYGKVAGTCKFTQCAQDFYDVDGNPANGCEYYCANNPDGTVKLDLGGDKCGIDDDCDGKIDEDVNLCSDPENCGKCGFVCVVVNGAGKCVTTAAAGTACDQNNTQCQVDHCNAGWVDADGSAANGCEYQCTPTGPEICDGIDNDCDGKIDNEDPDLNATNEPDLGQACSGGSQGVCADPANAGISKCIDATMKCCDPGSNDLPAVDPNFPMTGLRNGVCNTVPSVVIRPGQLPETCNGKDDDCDGQVDDNPIDVGGVCGTSVGACTTGLVQCVSGAPSCVGSTGAVPEACNGIDDDCDGVIDGTIPTGAAAVSCKSAADCAAGLLCMPRKSASDKVCAAPPADVFGTNGNPLVCNQPPLPPCVNSTGQQVACTTSGATPVAQPCKPGTLTCVSGAKICVNYVGPGAAVDICGADTNCDGRLDNQPDFANDPKNCGGCGNDCTNGGANHENFSCVNGKCQVGTTKCQPGFIDCDTNPADCETACIPTGAELCNGVDDNCNCKIDEPQGMAIPTPVQVCGVDPSATDPNCTTKVKVSCQNAAWSCAFPTGICSTGDCSTSPDPCDGIDNNCNGVADESFKLPFRTTKYLGLTCYSDDGKPPPGDGACRGQSTYQCKADGTDTVCPATFQSKNKGTEICDGIDNDCDGVVDEAYNSTAGAADGSYVKPAVVSIGTNKWIYEYEASRPNATPTTPGTGDGYFTSAPSGTTLDKTVACSVQNKIPWFNVTATEASQSCADRGGQLCALADWQTACHTSAATACTWGYATACTTAANYTSTSGPFCNLHGFDFDTSTAYIDDGLLVTGSTLLNNCDAKWGTSGVFDITGNLREITVNGSFYTLMGGAYDTASDGGATCDFTFYSVDKNFKLYDTGFRCCFSTNPSP